MSLTIGKAPFGPAPGGRFNFGYESPTGAVLFWDPMPERVRGRLGGETVVDSTNVRLLHETGHLPVYYFPEADVRSDLLEPTEKRSHCPHKGDARYWTIRAGGRTAEDAAWAYPEPLEAASFLAGHVAFYWGALDEWLVENEQIYGHPHDPYSRIDVYPSSRRARVTLDGEVLAESSRALVLFESGLPPRYYFPPEDVRVDLLERSERQTRCAYKGVAGYWHARIGETLHDDVAWAYPEPQHDGERVRDLIAFFNERVDIELDGELQERPSTPWSR